MVIDYEVFWLFLAVLSFLDVTCTYFILSFLKKIGDEPFKHELNPIQRFIMKPFKLKPLGLLVSALFGQLGLAIAYVLAIRYFPEMLFFCVGMYFTVLIYHADWIRTIIRHQHDEHYWSAYIEMGRDFA